MSDKIDFKKTLPCYKTKYERIDVVDVPDMRYLMIDGSGSPGDQNFLDAISTLYPVAYALKFASKLTLDKDYVVPPLEALWWSDDMSSFTTARDKSKWKWTVMLMTPDWITKDMLAVAMEKSAKKVPADRLVKIKLQELREGKCVQTLHIGSYDDEGPVLKHVHEEFIPGRGLKMTGHHHEIYLSDFRRVAPEKLKTILRQPVTGI